MKKVITPGVLVGWLLMAVPPVLIAQAPKPEAPAGSSLELYNRSQRALQTGQFEQAISGFQQLLDLAKDSKDPKIQQQLDAVYYGLGAAYFNARKFSEAVAALGELLKRFPNSRLVPEVQFFIAQCQFMLGEYQKAFEQLKVIEANPKYRDDALLLRAQTARKLNKPGDAVDPLQKLVGNDIRGSNAARGAIELALIYGEQGNAAKAVELLTLLSRRLRFLPNVAGFNQACMIVGDALLANNKQDEALACYRLMRRKEDLLALQKKQTEFLARQVENLKRRAAKEAPEKAAESQAEAARIEALVEEAKKAQQQFEKSPDNTPALLLRTAKALYDGDRKWEAIVAYDELLLRYPQYPEREIAVFGLAATYAEVGQYKQAQEHCDRFIKEFPKSELIEQVRFTKGTAAIEADDPLGAIKIFADLLKDKPDTKYKEEVSYMIANARFNMNDYEAARADYEAYVKAFPQGQQTDEVRYRIILCLVFGGKYEQAIKEFDDYIARNPQSPFIEDAMYRKMVSYFAAAVNDKSGKLYEKIIDYTAQFEKAYPESRTLGEVYGLRGDAFAGLDKDEEAAEAYLKGFRFSKSDETLNYNLFEAIKIWQKHGEWEKVAATLDEFLKANPDHASAPTAKYWIGKSLVKQRKIDEAKKFYAQQIRQYMTQPRRDAVEMMIRELVGVLAKKKRAVPAPAAEAPDRKPEPVPVPPEPKAAPAGENAAGAASEPIIAPVSPPPTPAVTEPAAPALPAEEELDQLIGGEQTLKNRTATARLFLARALLAQLKLDQQTYTTYLDQLADFEASDLSAFILGQLAEYLIHKADTSGVKGEDDARKAALAKAEGFCKELLSSFPKSEFVEMAYIGLGDIAYHRQNWQVAYQWFKDAIDVAGATYKTKEAIFGQAKSLLELGKLDEAKKLFEQVASTREWRGELTPRSVFNLGEIEFRQQKWNEAIAYYQRVYVSYQKYPEPMAKAYLQSARALVKLGKNAEALRSLGEMLRNDKLPQSYRDEARKLMKELGGD